MRFLFSLLSKTLFLLFLVIAHFFLSYTLPFPFNTLNIIFASLVLYMVFSESGSVVWMAFFTHFCIELYSVSSFGIILLSSTLSILFTYWFFQFVFTKKSWYSIPFVAFLSLALYRAISLLLLVLIGFITKDTAIPWGSIFILAAWELFFTELVVMIGYGCIPFIKNAFRPKIQRAL